MRIARRAAPWLLFSLVVAIGCGAGRATYHDPRMDFGVIQTVAVMPIDNLTPERDAAGRVRNVLMTMLQATGAVYVLPPGEVGRGISRTSVENPFTPTSAEAVALANNIGADAIITGTLREYGEVRSGSATANVISLGLSMLEAETGRVVWSASSTKGGISTADRFFGGGGRPMNVVTQEAIEDLLDQLFK
jgi:hypothetical protein